MKLAIFDYDGTLFASPLRPSWWPFQGFWGRPESLSPPYVPERPEGDWWAPTVVAGAKRAMADSDTYTVLLTGRPPKLASRIKELLHHAGLRFDEYHFSNDDTLSFKLRVMESLVNKLQPEQVTLWEDRDEHIGDFKAKLSSLGVEHKIHKMPRVTHEFENPPTTAALRVAARWQRRLADIIGDPVSLIRNFEIVVNDLAVLEKDIPWMQEAEKVWNEEGKFWSHVDIQRMRTEADPKYKKNMEYRNYLHDFVLKVKFSSHGFQRAQAPFLFLGILQQYDLPPNVRKSVEAAAKYHSSRRKAPSRDDALQAYMKMMSLIRGQLDAAKAAIMLGKPRGSAEGQPEAGQADLRAGPFRIVNTGGFDDKTMAEVQAVVEKSAQLLQAKGISQVLYGDVLVSRTLSKQNVLAFYLPQKDEMFVRANLRGKQHDAVRTICHELGHRLHFKFLKAKDQEIRRIYAQVARKTDWATKKNKIQEVLKDHPVLPGDTLVGKKNTIYEVTGTGYGKGGIQVELRRKDNPTLKAHIGLEGYLMTKGLLTDQDLSSFVTSYAQRNHEENFAEMIAFYCLDKLPEDQVEMLKAVL
jgi:hypothetical protein